MGRLCPWASPPHSWGFTCARSPGCVTAAPSSGRWATSSSQLQGRQEQRTGPAPGALAHILVWRPRKRKGHLAALTARRPASCSEPKNCQASGFYTRQNRVVCILLRLTPEPRAGGAKGVGNHLPKITSRALRFELRSPRRLRLSSWPCCLAGLAPAPALSPRHFRAARRPGCAPGGSGSGCKLLYRLMGLLGSGELLL